MSDTPFPARGDRTPEAVRVRMAQFCEWFDVEPVKLNVRKGEVYLTEGFMTWIKSHGASLDWICYGGEKGMAVTYREKYAQTPDQQEFANVIGQFTKAEQEILLDCLEAHKAGRLNLDQAMADFRSRVTAHRAA